MVATLLLCSALVQASGIGGSANRLWTGSGSHMSAPRRPSFAASVWVDSCSTGSAGTKVLTFSLNNVAGVLLVVAVSDETDNVTGVTYNGVNVPLLAYGKTVGGNNISALYSLLNPALGANNVVVTCSSADSKVAGAITFANATTIVFSGSNAGAAATACSATVLSTSTNNVIVSNLIEGSGTTATTPAPPAKECWSAIFGLSVNEVRGAGSTQPATGSSLNVGWVVAGDKRWSIVSAEVWQ